MDRTRIVRWLRVLFPLAALAILSVLFLLSRKPDPDAGVPYAKGAIEELARNPGMTAPQFSTVTADGTTVTLTADRASPGPEGAAASNLALDWTTREGTAARLTATAADQQGAQFTLQGNVAMTLSTGWHLTAPRIEADTAAARLAAPQEVAVTAPFGTLTAGGMVLTRAADGAQVLELNRSVHLIYRP